MKGKLNRYAIHRVLGLIFIPFLFISVVTGFFRANYQWFWKQDYKKIKNLNFENNIKVPVIAVDSLFLVLKKHYGEKIAVSEIKLKSEAGKLFYDVKLKNHYPVLVDAEKGELLSPLSKELAKLLATQYVKADYKIKSIYLDENYRTRKEKKLRPVYIATFDDPLHTKIYIDKNNGEIEEEIDDNLQIGFWMVKLHDYDFLENKRINLSFVAIGLFSIACSGFYLWLKKKKRKKSGYAG